MEEMREAGLAVGARDPDGPQTAGWLAEESSGDVGERGAGVGDDEHRGLRLGEEREPLGLAIGMDGEGGGAGGDGLPQVVVAVRLETGDGDEDAAG